jgi:hypothetical protein
VPTPEPPLLFVGNPLGRLCPRLGQYLFLHPVPDGILLVRRGRSMFGMDVVGEFEDRWNLASHYPV